MVRCYKNCANCGYHEHTEPCCPKPCCPPSPCCHGVPCEHDITCCEPACMRPCWDTCKCMDEILKLKKTEDKDTTVINNLEGRVEKVENDLVDFNANIVDQFGRLAQKEQHDFDCLQDGINDERDRAMAAESNLNDRIAAEENRAQAKETELDGKIDAETNERLLRDITDADYNKPNKTIDFKRQDGSIVKSIDVTDFIVDGMVDSVTWNQNTRDLTIVWNTDAGKQPTVIHGDDIFDIDNYYTKPEIDAKVIGINDSINIVNSRVSYMNSRLDTVNSRIDSTNSDVATTNLNLATLNSKVDSMIEDTVDYAEVIDWGQTEAIAKVNNKIITVGIPEFPNVIQQVVVDNDGHLLVFNTDNPEEPTIYDLPAGYVNRVTHLEEITEQQQTTIHNQQQTINNLVNNVIPALEARIQALETDNLWYLDSTTGKVTTKNSKAAAAYGFYDTDPNMR